MITTDIRDAADTWNIWVRRREAITELASLRRRHLDADAAMLSLDLATGPQVSALDALHANQRVVNLLLGQRWAAMMAAREDGHTWAQIGGALGCSKQAAHAAFKAAVEAMAASPQDYTPDDVKAARELLRGWK